MWEWTEAGSLTSHHHKATEAGICPSDPLLCPAHHCNPHFMDCSGAEATFQPEWSALTAVKHSERSGAIDARALPSPIPHPLIVAEPGRGSCNSAESTVGLVASGYRRVAAGTERHKADHRPRPPWGQCPEHEATA